MLVTSLSGSTMPLMRLRAWGSKSNRKLHGHFAKMYSKEKSISNIIYSIANKPGIKIFPGDIKKAINILSEGKSVNYEGATGVEFDKVGDTLGSFVEVDFNKGKLKSKKLR